jgi:NNP family nitrate/nitrite transporter-like MFS transporter
MWFLNFVGRTMFTPVLPLIEDEFQISHARASSIFLFLSLGFGASLFFSGFLSGIFGYKKSIVGSFIALAVVFFCISFVKVFSTLYVFSLVIGMASGVYLPAAIPLITSCYSEKVWGKAIAIHDSAASIAVFGIPIIALFLIRFLDWRGVFTVFGVVFLIAAMVFYFFFDELKVGKLNRTELGSLIRRKSLWVMSSLWIIAASTTMGVYFIVPLYLTKELSLDISYANTIFGISRLGGFFVAVSSGFVISRLNLQKIMAFILIISGVFTVFLAVAGLKLVGIALFLQASVIYGFFPAGFVAISKIFDLNLRAIATGFILGCAAIVGWGVTPFLLGLSGDYLSFRFGILMLGVTTILSSGLVFLVREIRSGQ